jgi:hypothetical protein
VAVLIPNGYVRIKDAILGEAGYIASILDLGHWSHKPIGECEEQHIRRISWYFDAESVEYSLDGSQPVTFQLHSNDVTVPPEMETYWVVAELLQTQVRLRLHRKQVATVGLDLSGCEIEIPESFWLTDSAKLALDPFSINRVPISPELILEECLISDQNAAKLFAQESATRDHPDAMCSGDAQTREKYLSPYMRLMVRGTSELGITAENRVLKKVVESWLRENWPSDLGKPSAGRVKYMAAFMRDPAHERGGYVGPRRPATSKSKPGHMEE